MGLETIGQGRHPWKMGQNPFWSFNISPEIIQLGVLIYVRLPLSLQNVEDLLYRRSKDVCHESVRWRNQFITTYLERDSPLLGPCIPAEALRRFWTMLAHNQGGMINASQLARNLGVTAKTTTGFLDLLVDFLSVRRPEPYVVNISKRLVKSSKV